MESLNNESPKNTSKKKGVANDTQSAGRPKMKDNNDDNEFATTPLKASVAEVASTHGGAAKVEATTANATATTASSPAEKVSNGSADKIEESAKVAISMIEQKLNAKMDDLAALVSKAGSQIQRLGEALCRIGDKVEHLPERHFASRKTKSERPVVH